MLLWSLLCSTLSWGSDPSRIEGFGRLWVDPDVVVLTPNPTGPRPKPEAEAAPESLWLCNPHLAPSIVTVGTVAVGELQPRSQAVVHAVRPGLYTVAFSTPEGFVRTASIRSRAHPPDHCEPL